MFGGDDPPLTLTAPSIAATTKTDRLHKQRRRRQQRSSSARRHARRQHQNNGSSPISSDSSRQVQPSNSPAVNTPSDLLRFGLKLVGFSLARQAKVRARTNRERFISHFGVGPETIMDIINDLKDIISTKTWCYTDALMAFHWLKLYDTEHVLAGRWQRGEDYIRNKIKFYVEKIQSLKEKKIVFGGFDEEEIFIISVDTVNFKTQEFRLDPDAHWFDFKSNSSGLKYEIGVSLRRSSIVWVRGPFPAGNMHDRTLFCGGKKDTPEHLCDKNALFFKMPPGKKAIGDSAYDGIKNVAVTRDGQTEEFKKFLGRAKNRGETVHWKLKSFQCLGGRFRHGRSTKKKMAMHQMCVEAVCVIAQYDMKYHPLFDL